MGSLVFSGQYDLRGEQGSVLHALDMQVLKAKINALDRRIANDVLGEIESLKSMPENWDSYGARLIVQRAIDNAFNFISKVRDDDSFAAMRPIVAPDPNGGVLLKWEAGGQELVFWFLADEKACVCLEKKDRERKSYKKDSLDELLDIFKKWSSGC